MKEERMLRLKCKLVKNRTNNQINISLPKKKIEMIQGDNPPKFLDVGFFWKINKKKKKGGKKR